MVDPSVIELVNFEIIVLVLVYSTWLRFNKKNHSILFRIALQSVNHKGKHRKIMCEKFTWQLANRSFS
jgi:hypothetical protein